MESQILQQQIAEQRIPGLAAAVQKGDTVVFESYSGFANHEHQVAVTRDTVFEIASITKLFTSQSILRLAQDGKLKLDDPIASYLDNLPDAWKPVTIRHCLTHQSGIPSYTAPKSYWQITRDKKSPHEILDLVRDMPVSFAPGERYSYDNTGFYLLGMLIEAVAQMPYADYLRQTIFEPCGMTHTQGNDYERIVPHRAQGYALYEDVLCNKDFYDTSNTFSAGIVLSSALDLVRWRVSIYTDVVLNEDFRKQWWTPHPSKAANEREFSYTMGLGWFIVDVPDGVVLGHGGGITGFRSTFLHYPASDVTVALLVNGAHVNELETHAQALVRELKVL